MIDLLAQFDLPATEFWSERGILGIAAMIVAVGLTTAFTVLWLPHQRRKNELALEHLKAKQQLEIEKEVKTIRFIENAGEAFPRIANSQERMSETLDRVDRRQEGHTEDCRTTAQTVEQIAGHLRIGGA